MKQEKMDDKKEETTESLKQSAKREPRSEDKEQNEEALIKAKNFSAKRMDHEREDIAFKIKPGVPIAEMPENISKSTQAYLKKKSQQKTLVNAEENVDIGEMHIKERHGLVEHPDF